MHVVRSGETLGGIALKYHTTTATLMRSNGLRRPLIFPGQSSRRLAARFASAKTSSRAKATSQAKRRQEVRRSSAVEPTSAKATTQSNGRRSATTNPATEHPASQKNPLIEKTRCGSSTEADGSSVAVSVNSVVKQSSKQEQKTGAAKRGAR